MNAAKLISTLGLMPHPEGGFYKRIYEHTRRDSQQRLLGASIYYLLESSDFSAFHRIDCDELWHFYAGVGLLLHQINENGELKTELLGNPLLLSDATPTSVVPAGSWFAAEPASSSGFCLVGCTTVPAFQFENFELADRHSLQTRYPQHASLIKKLTRQPT